MSVENATRGSLKLRLALSDLAAAKESLAIANDSIQTLKQAYEDAHARLEIAGALSRESLRSR